MTKITDETPIAMLTVGQLKEILGIDQILGFTNLRATERFPFASRSMAEGVSTFCARRLSTGCKANRTRRSNNTVITKLNTKQSKL